MCLEKVTVRRRITKNDIHGWKVVETAYGLMLSPVAETIINKGVNKAQDLSNQRDLKLVKSPVKPGFCIFRRKRDALNYKHLYERHFVFELIYERHFVFECKIIKVKVPKGTEVSLGTMKLTCSDDAKVIVAQKIIV